MTHHSPSLTSILLSSLDPDRLHAWYVAVLPPQEDTTYEQYRMMKYGEFTLIIDTRGDIGARSPEPGRMILNFDVADANAVVARLDEMGAEWLAKLEDRDGSYFATAVDPDGNYVQIIQMSEEARASM